MTTCTRLSVVIPAYGNPESLKRCLQSLIGQEALEEVVVVDDGSDPSLENLVQSFRSGVPSVRYVYQSNRGPGSARNRGVLETTGNFIAFVDSDDEVMQIWSRTLAGLITSQTVLASGGAELRSVDRVRTVQPRSLGPAFSGIVACFQPGAYVVYRRLFEDVGGFDTACLYGEHAELGLRFSQAMVKRGLAANYTGAILVRRHVDRSPAKVGSYDKARAFSGLYTVQKHHDLFSRDRKLLSAFLAVSGVACARLGDLEQARRLLVRSAVAHPSFKSLGRVGLSLVPRIGRRVWLRRDVVKEEG